MLDENDQQDLKKEQVPLAPTPELKPEEMQETMTSAETHTEVVHDEDKPPTENNLKEEAVLPAEEIKTTDLRPGMTVRVHQKIKEGEKNRIQIFQGMILALRGKTSATKTMTVGKRSFGVYVERIYPLASPLIEKIEVVKQAKVRHSKLYFLKDYAKRLKETFVTQ